MITGTEIQAWAPVIFALRNPNIFYPTLIATFVAAALIWWFLPMYMGWRRYPADGEKAHAAEAALRKDISIFFGGSVVVFGLIAALIQFQANLEREHRQQRDSQAQLQANLEREHRQQKAALASENTKLFDKAVGLLESKSTTGQVGGIYAFSELLKQDGFYWPTVAQLSTFLREKLPATATTPERAWM